MTGMQLKLYAAVAFCFILQVGCGGGSDDSPPRAAVQGTVLLDDKPLPEGVIYFIPKGETEGPKTSTSIADGEFSLPEDLGPLVGTHRVEIVSTDDGGLAPDDETAIERMREQGIRKIERIEVPQAYNRRSTLEAVIVEEDVNELEYKLSSTPRKR